MIRKTLISQKQNIDILLPESYLNKRIEILIIPYMENSYEDFKYWSSDELDDISLLQYSEIKEDSEDYSTW
jgi:hypothetical protein